MKQLELCQNSNRSCLSTDCWGRCLHDLWLVTSPLLIIEESLEDGAVRYDADEEDKMCLCVPLTRSDSVVDEVKKPATVEAGCTRENEEGPKRPLPHHSSRECYPVISFNTVIWSRIKGEYCMDLSEGTVTTCLIGFMMRNGIVHQLMVKWSLRIGYLNGWMIDVFGGNAVLGVSSNQTTALSRSLKTPGL